MSGRVDEELALLRRAFPDVEYDAATHWVRIPAYPLPEGVWSEDGGIEVACRIPTLLAENPYAFWVRPGLTLPGSKTIQNYTFPVTTPFGAGWGQFSWQLESWTPKTPISSGTNMVDFVRSFGRRLEQGA